MSGTFSTKLNYSMKKKKKRWFDKFLSVFQSCFVSMSDNLKILNKIWMGRK